GMNSVILHGALIAEGALVAAMSVVPAGMQVPRGTLVAGVPARVRKELTGDSAAWVRDSASHYVELSRSYLEQSIGVPAATQTDTHRTAAPGSESHERDR